MQTPHRDDKTARTHREDYTMHDTKGWMARPTTKQDDGCIALLQRKRMHPSATLSNHNTITPSARLCHATTQKDTLARARTRHDQQTRNKTYQSGEQRIRKKRCALRFPFHSVLMRQLTRQTLYPFTPSRAPDPLPALKSARFLHIQRAGALRSGAPFCHHQRGHLDDRIAAAECTHCS